LWAVASGCVVAVVILAGSSWWLSDRTKVQISHFVDRDIETHLVAANTLAAGLQRGQALRNYVLDPDNKKSVANYTTAAKQLDGLLIRLDGLLKSIPGGSEKAVELSERTAKYLPAQQKVFSLIEAGDLVSAKQLMISDETPAWRNVREILLEVVKTSEASAKEGRIALDQSQETARNVVLTIGTLIILFISLALAYIGREVFRQVGGEPSSTAAILDKISGGDLTERIQVDPSNKASILGSAFTMQSYLLSMLGDISQSVSTLGNVSTKLNLNAGNVSSASEQQSESASAIAAAIEQLTVSIGVMSDNAILAADLSKTTETTIREGYEGIQATTQNIQQVATSMMQSSQQMDDLAKKVDSINSIASTIREIAEQTNLLALNAAIEAARAGEQGRGFAVVADEVRKLAERTTVSTREISEVLDSVRSTTQSASLAMNKTKELALQGALQTEQVQSTVHGLDTAAVQVREAIDSISNGLREQSSVSTDIAQRVESIAGGIEQTAAAMNDVKGLVGTLVGESDTLNRQVGKFKIVS
jgi:methyl-accepting chemotaxis protein